MICQDPLWIALSDGTKIAATLWRPATDSPVPAIVEMLPYRRRDGTVTRDLDMHPYYAGHGIATLRADLRGSGDSDGLLDDEYLPREQLDACEIIAWIAAQAWCNGSVGMHGISWGGFNALQVAALRPPALKAIITLCASDDRYADDIHYMGGALITEQEMWSNFMLVKKALPPDPQIVGARWEDMWRQRLAGNRSLSEIWLRHQRRDDFWKQGSACEDYAAIGCAVMAVCGWEDSYSNFVPRLLANLKCPSLGIVGPWSHAFPCRGSPGPLIGYLQEAIRWWKHWLGGEDTGIMGEPRYRVWIASEERPRPFYFPDHAGQWAAEESWPSPRIEDHIYFLNEGELGREATPGGIVSVKSPATAGIDCGRWGGYGGTCPDMAIDQQREDAFALCFDTEPLADDLTLLGAPIAELEITVDKPLVNLTARLCDLYPDGTSALMTYGVLNLSHRHSHESPEPCPVDTLFKVRLQLNDFARTIPKGHRIRLALATQHWPIVWPQPYLAKLGVMTRRSILHLPVRPPHALDGKVSFEPAETAPPAPLRVIAEGNDSRVHEEEHVTGVRTITLQSDHGTMVFEDRDITVRSWNRDRFTIHPDDPLSARLTTEYEWSIKSGPADTATYARTELTADAGNFHLSWHFECRSGGRLVHEAGASRKIKRDYC